MERKIYQETARVEDRHWWFTARRRIARDLLDRLPLPPAAKLLEAGCGSGGNLAMLAAYGRVYGFEIDDTARTLARSRGIGEIEHGSLPDHVPFSGTAFDLIALFDVLEHVEADEASLRALHARLAAGGFLLLTVPAGKALWSRHDVEHHHHRRYSLKELEDKVRRAGFTIERISYFNFWLFPLIYAVRRIENFLSSTKSHQTAGMEVPPAPVNALLYALFASERFLLRWTRLPFGVSLILVASKPRI